MRELVRDVKNDAKPHILCTFVVHKRNRRHRNSATQYWPPPLRRAILPLNGFSFVVENQLLQSGLAPRTPEMIPRVVLFPKR